MKKAWLLAGLLLVGVVTYGADVQQKRAAITHTIDRTGDTAQVMIFELSDSRASLIDSFSYVDTIRTASNTDSASIIWLSPVQTMTVGTDFGATFDTAQTYGCTLLFSGSDELGFEFDATGFSDSTVVFVRNLSDSINTITDLTDSVTSTLSSDSTSLTITCNFSRFTMGGRWSTLFAPDSLDTTTLNTIEMWCDSMTAYINDASCSTYVTAANSGDTIVQVTSDQAGLAFTAIVTDSATDTTHSQLNVTSVSHTTDTTDMFSMSLPETYRGLYGYIILQASGTTGSGYGASDSAYIRWYTTLKNTWYLIAQDSAASMPCTLAINYPSNHGTVVTDSLWKDQMKIITTIMDSTTDTSMAPVHYLDYYFLRYEK